MEFLVVQAKVMRNLVNEGDVNLITKMIEVIACGYEGFSEQNNAVGKLSESVVAAFGQCEPVVEAEQIEGPVFGTVFNNKHHVVESVDHVVGKFVELVRNEFFELVFGYVKARHESATTAAGAK